MRQQQRRACCAASRASTRQLERRVTAALAARAVLAAWCSACGCKGGSSATPAAVCMAVCVMCWGDEAHGALVQTGCGIVHLEGCFHVCLRSVLFAIKGFDSSEGCGWQGSGGWSSAAVSLVGTLPCVGLPCTHLSVHVLRHEACMYITFPGGLSAAAMDAAVCGCALCKVT